MACSGRCRYCRPKHLDARIDRRVVAKARGCRWKRKTLSFCPLAFPTASTFIGFFAREDEENFAISVERRTFVSLADTFRDNGPCPQELDVKTIVSRQLLPKILESSGELRSSRIDQPCENHPRVDSVQRGFELGAPVVSREILS